MLTGNSVESLSGRMLRLRILQAPRSSIALSSEERVSGVADRSSWPGGMRSNRASCGVGDRRTSPRQSCYAYAAVGQSRHGRVVRGA